MKFRLPTIIFSFLIGVFLTSCAGPHPDPYVRHGRRSGAVVGGIIDRQFDGTITPISIGFVISSSIAFAAWRWASSAEQAA